MKGGYTAELEGTRGAVPAGSYAELGGGSTTFPVEMGGAGAYAAEMSGTNNYPVEMGEAGVYAVEMGGGGSYPAEMGGGGSYPVEMGAARYSSELEGTPEETDFW